MRTLIHTALAILAVATTFSFTATPASAQYRGYGQGGVIPCSQDDYRFVPGRGWVSNCRGHVGIRPGIMHRGHMGGGMQHNREVQTQTQTRSYTSSRTCVDWVIRNGVKTILNTRAC